MNIQVQDLKSKPAAASLGIADCDIHPVPRSGKDLYPFMEKRWQEELERFGMRSRRGFEVGSSYPKAQRNAARRDAWPPNGGKPGSDLAFMQSHHLDAHNIALGVLNPVGDNGQPSQNQEFGAAYCRATNDWQVEYWTSREPRLRASVVVPYENAPAAVAEIERWAGHPHFVQVIFQSRSADPFGNRRYWPIYAAAEAAGLPIGVHAFGIGGHAITSGGWPSYYIEDMVSHSAACQSLLVSMVVEGVFETFPKLKLVLIETGFGWLPTLGWRLDKIWKKLRDETPHLRRAPSEVIREHVWVTSQPMEEPEVSAHLADTIRWIGADRLMFSTDYPHWDFDDPARALPIRLEETQRQAFFRDNAFKLYCPQ